MRETNTDIEIKRAAQLSIAEIGIGSIGHGFKIPLTGQLLSLNQLGFLLNALNRDKLLKASVFEISGITSVLKSFSPAGQKLGPMLSIAMQGFLFWLGTTLLGVNIFGQLLGAALLALWAFVQPLITLFIIYGFDLVKVSEFYLQKISADYSFIAMALAYALITVLVIKMLLAIGMVFLSYSFKKNISVLGENKVSDYMLTQVTLQSSTSPLKAALRDLTKPLFLLSFILMLVFIWQFNGSTSQKIWMSLRPLAIAFILFYILRSPWVAVKLLSLSKRSKRFEKIYLNAQKALNLLTPKD
jgi:hypothetical protein